MFLSLSRKIWISTLFFTIVGTCQLVGSEQSKACKLINSGHASEQILPQHPLGRFRTGHSVGYTRVSQLSDTSTGVGEADRLDHSW